MNKLRKKRGKPVVARYCDADSLSCPTTQAPRPTLSTAFTSASYRPVAARRIKPLAQRPPSQKSGPRVLAPADSRSHAGPPFLAQQLLVNLPAGPAQNLGQRGVKIEPQQVGAPPQFHQLGINGARYAHADDLGPILLTLQYFHCCCPRCPRTRHSRRSRDSPHHYPAPSPSAARRPHSLLVCSPATRREAVWPTVPVRP